MFNRFEYTLPFANTLLLRDRDANGVPFFLRGRDLEGGRPQVRSRFRVVSGAAADVFQASAATFLRILRRPMTDVSPPASQLLSI